MDLASSGELLQSSKDFKTNISCEFGHALRPHRNVPLKLIYVGCVG